jgi:hypothetical protein
MRAAAMQRFIGQFGGCSTAVVMNKVEAVNTPPHEPYAEGEER